MLINVQERSVSATLKPSYRLTSQKPESLTCDSAVAPAAIVTTSSARCHSEGWSTAVTGASRAAAATIATVAEPCSTQRPQAADEAVGESRVRFGVEFTTPAPGEILARRRA